MPNYTDSRAGLLAATEHMQELQRAYQWAQALAFSIVDGCATATDAQEFIDRFAHLTNTASTLG